MIILIRVNKKEYTDARHRIRAFIKKNKRLPKYCTFKTQNGKETKLTTTEYCGLFQGYMQFYQKHGREPNYLTLNSKASIPMILNYQDDKYSCCPASLQMALMFLFDYKYESYLKKTLGTTTSGTSPEKLINGAKKLGYKVTSIDREFRLVKKALNEYKPVLMHIQTKPAKCLGYLNDYGHWIVCYRAGDNTYYIADPTKGYKKCNMNTINKATNGRNIKYYTVEMI